MTSGRMRRLAALTMMGLAFSACAGGDRLDKADAPQTGQTTSTGGSPDSSQPAAGTSGEGRADFGLADAAAALGATIPSTPGGNPSAPATGGSVLPGGLPNAGAPLDPGGSPGGAAPAPSGGADTGSGSGGAASGGSGSARPKIAATPEECAMLRQLMAIVDHPQLHQLKADTGC